MSYLGKIICEKNEGFSNQGTNKRVSKVALSLSRKIPIKIVESVHIGRITLLKSLVTFCVFMVLVGCFIDRAEADMKKEKANEKRTFHVGEIVKNGFHGIKIVGVKKKTNSDYIGTGSSLPSNHISLEITIIFLNNGVELKVDGLNSNADNSPEIKNEIEKIYLIDVEKHKYQSSYSNITRWKNGGKYEAIFIVPRNSKGYKLGYQDLPLIELGL